MPRFLLFGGARIESDAHIEIPLTENQRELLTVLLLRVNELVSSDVLIDHIWADGLPRNPENSLHDLVSRFRRRIGDVEKRLLVTIERNYRLVVAPELTDVGLVRSLARAGLAVDAAEPVLAEAFLSAALEHARGDLPDVLPDSLIRGDVDALDRLCRESVARLEGRRDHSADDRPPRRTSVVDRWSSDEPAALVLQLERLDLLVLARIVNETRLVGGSIVRLSEGCLVASLPRAAAAVECACGIADLLAGQTVAPPSGAVGLLAPNCGGRAVDDVATLSAGAAPGQILVAPAVRQAVVGLQASARIVAAGDGAWQLGAARLPRSGGSDDDAEMPIIGRDADVAALRTLVGQTSPLTIRGPGGIGKTRLAIEVARLAADRFTDGTVRVDLAEADRHGGPLPLIIRSLGYFVEPYRPPLETLVDRLAGRNVLLVLDSCEAFVDHASATCDALLTGCPRVAILAASRVALEARNERIYDLDELSAAATAEMLRRLIPDRQRTGSGVADDDAIGRLGRLVGGMPLAIQCVAPLVVTRGPTVLADLLETLPDGTVLPVLDAAMGGRGRHPSIERSLLASYRFLRADDARMFERASSMRGAFSSDDALAAADDGEKLIAARLRRLHEASLLKHEPPDRWRMLEPVRQFAATLLLQHGGSIAQSDRHAAHFATFTEKAELGLRSADEATWFRLVGETYPNLTTALGWAVERRDATTALRLTSSLWWYWAALGMAVEGTQALERALAVRAAAPPRLRAKALVALGHLSWWAGNPNRTRSSAEAALDLVRTERPSDPWLGAWAGAALAASQMWGGGDRAAQEKNLDESIARFSSIGDRTGMGLVLEVHGGLAWHHGDYATCRAKSAEALEVFEEAGHQTMIAQGRRVLGLATALEGEVDSGRDLVEAGLRLSEEIGDVGGMPLGLAYLGLVEVCANQMSQAVDAFRASLMANRLRGEVWPALLAIAFAGGYAVDTARHVDGLTLLSSGAAITGRTGIRLAPRELERAAAAEQRAREALAVEDAAAAATRGTELGVADAMVLALDVLGP